MKYFVGFLFLTACSAFASSFTRGENLISSFSPEHPKFDNYKSYEKSDSSSRSYLWVSGEFGDKDTYKINIELGHKSADLTKLQKALNKPGIDKCKAFKSINLNTENSNGYSQLTWETTCDFGDSNAYILHKAISGKDSLYLARKFWYRDVETSTIDEWKMLFQELYLCDTQKKNHPCPEGYKKIEGANEM